MFCKGFFPHKKAVLSGYAESGHEDSPAIFDRLVFVVVDALRSDFAFGPHSSMHKLHEMINAGTAIPFTARASTPTVTLPRLKCLTTGAITGFLDAILNIAESDTSSTVASQDSWVQQMLNDKRKIHMYGDDTWMRLYPGAFSESEGTSSFFVKDFTEVDNNVTRHLETQLKSPDWDTLILHYLGLDHIGHLEGPSSPHMLDKQLEMDTIISEIYQTLSDPDATRAGETLVIVLGDHGMTGDGNHGGASDAETQTAIALISRLFSTRVDMKSRHWPPAVSSELQLDLFDSILQSDIVPTLSMALGLPIPKNSLGVIPSTILQTWESDVERVKAVAQNARQLQQLLIAGEFPPAVLRTGLACTEKTADNECSLTGLHFDHSNTDASELSFTISEMYKAMYLMQEILMSASNDYNMLTMCVGLGCLVIALFSLCYQQHTLLTSWKDRLILLAPILHSATAFASSFVEEEQVFWYYLTTMGLLLIAVSSFSSSSSVLTNSQALLPLAFFRALRRYNQTGQKFAGASCISTYMEQLGFHDSVPFVLVMSICLWDIVSSKVSLKQQIIHTVAAINVSVFKLSLLDMPVLAIRGAWISIGLSALGPLVTGDSISMVPISLFFILQSRPQNWLLLLLFRPIMSFMKASHSKNTSWTIVTFLAIQQASFFATGNSNSLSGLDLSQAYNGIATYSELCVGTLLFLSTFLGPLYWHFALLQWLQTQPPRVKEFTRTFMAMSACMYNTALCVSCFILRHHLFVFSVFSPKLLFSGAWIIFYSLTVVLM